MYTGIINKISSTHQMNGETTVSTEDIKYFVPIFGSYYHFICESVLGLYNMLWQESIVDSLNCNLWYQGNYVEVVQLFSGHPVIRVPLLKPYLKDASTLRPNIKTLSQPRLRAKDEFHQLLPLADFLSHRIPVMTMEKGITIIRREHKRAYLETDELADSLKLFQIPVRVVQMECESFSSQVNIMRGTSILISPHGAGTINQIFMPRGGNIIELFPKGHSNWHAKAVADVFDHDLTEVESAAPSEFGREPTEAIRRNISENGWPDRMAVRALRKHKSDDLCRVIRDVKSFSIDPKKIIGVVDRLLSH
jgi:hypothetical protein